MTFTLSGETIALCDLLKCAGLAGSSGQGKHLVADGSVRVDGQPESRKTAKIRAGQVVECGGARVLVCASSPSADAVGGAGAGAGADADAGPGADARAVASAVAGCGVSGAGR